MGLDPCEGPSFWYRINRLFCWIIYRFKVNNHLYCILCKALELWGALPAYVHTGSSRSRSHSVGSVTEYGDGTETREIGGSGSTQGCPLFLCLERVLMVLLQRVLNHSHYQLGLLILLRLDLIKYIAFHSVVHIMNRRLP